MKIFTLQPFTQGFMTMGNTILPSFFKMLNVIQTYPWGSKTSLSELFDIANPHSEHQAEIWMGSHLNGCSVISVNNKQILLSDFIATDPRSILGDNTHSRFGELPYLFKVLAAEKALSIQVHPSKTQAEIGFAKEDSKNIPRNSGNRNYKDPNHKPELVFAITPYKAMNGFREIKEIVTKFQEINITVLANLVDIFSKNQSNDGLEVFFQAILSLNEVVKKSALIELVSYAKQHKKNEIMSLILDFSNQYPGDIGLFSPLILNVLTLQPGEAMYLDASTPHAYINGTALEVMASSDNVLRAGLTPKYIDVPELIANTSFKPIPYAELLLFPSKKEGGLHYPIPVPDFKFSIYEKVNRLRISTNSAEILFAINASLAVKNSNDEEVIISKGESLFIPAYTKNYMVSSEGCFARAYN